MRRSVPSMSECFRAASDGQGAVVHLPDDSALDAWIAGASANGFIVVDVTVDDDERAFAFGPLWGALLAVETVVGVTPVASVAASPRSIEWMTRELDATISRLAASAPVLIVVRDRSSLDLVGAVELDRLVEIGEPRPVVWLFGLGAATGSATISSGAPAVLTAEERSLLQILAVTEPALTTAELGELSGIPADRVDEALSRMRSVDAVAICRDHIAIRTASLSHSLVADLPVALVRAIRRGALDLLDRRGAITPPVAEVALASARVEDELAIRILTDAMRATREEAPETAVVYGMAAASLLEGPSEERTDLAWQLLPLLWQTGRIEEGQDLATRVFAERGRVDAVAQTMLWLGRFEESSERALRLTETALALAGLSGVVRTRLLALHLRLLSTLGRADDVARLLGGAIAEARQAGDLESLSRLQSCDGIQHFYRGEYTRSVELTREAEETWTASAAEVAEHMPEMIWAPHLRLVLGDPEGARSELTRLLTIIAAHDRPLASRFIYSEIALASLALGELDAAADDAVAATTASGREWSLPPRTLDRVQAIQLSVRLKVALHRGDATRLTEMSDLLDATTTPIQSESSLRVSWWRFLIDDALGTPAATDAKIETLGHLPWLDPADEILLARALLNRGFTQSAIRLAGLARERVALSGTHPLAVALDHHLSGLLAHTPDALEAASRGWRRLHRPLLAASSLAEAGAAHVDRGGLDGVAMMRAAHQELSSLGAHRDAWMVRKALRARGHIVGEERAPSRDPLTPTERRVVDRAVLGQTVNRIADELALSPHTVTTHLRHVYAKLGVRSRTELIEWSAADRGH